MPLVNFLAIVAVLIRYCLIGIHAKKLDIQSDVNSHSCMEKGEVFMYCSAFSRLRLKHLVSHTFGKPDTPETDNKFVIGIYGT